MRLGSLKLSKRHGVLLLTSAVLIAALSYGLRRVSRLADTKLTGGVHDYGVSLYSAPVIVSKGDAIAVEDITFHLRAAGYSTDPTNRLGHYSVEGASIVVAPGPDSYFRREPARIVLKDGVVSEVEALGSKARMDDYALEPQSLVRVASGARQKVRPLHFREIPKVVINALISAEDKHFFAHAGFDLRRILKAAWVNTRRGRKEQGGSTLTMQLARMLYLEADKTWSRKLEELILAEALEVKLTKEEIFERYVNGVYLGRRNAIELQGFGQAAETFFNKKIGDVTLPEAALLAGLVQRPSYLDPERHPERAIARRNLVLSLMHQNGFITTAEREQASQAPLKLAPQSEWSDSPWFIDLALDDLQQKKGTEIRGRVLTTLDPILQRDAVEAVESAMKQLDKKLARRKENADPEVALVALDPRTGEVRALVGGRNFSRNQVNHAIAMRQPGSAFKPFVYAAALSSSDKVFTPATVVSDEPTMFRFAGQNYEPGNFGDEFYGDVTLRRALAKSINVATVKIAEEIGYGRVLQVARDAGMNDALGASPALALGAYESTPLELAGAYTTFANQGVYVAPVFVSEVRSSAGEQYVARPVSRRVLDSANAFLIHDMLMEVMRSGTAAGSRSRGLTAPAAGKTGTTRDGWFAGYVSNLVCVVWVGYDDNRDLKLEGSKSALPVWTEFMKRATRRVAHRQPLAERPAGVTGAQIDSETGLLAGPDCTQVRWEYFVRGSEPKEMCVHEAPPPFTPAVGTTLVGDSR